MSATIGVEHGNTCDRVTTVTEAALDHSSDEAQLRKNTGVVTEWDFQRVLMMRWLLLVCKCIKLHQGSCNTTSGRQSQLEFTAH